MTRTTYRLRGDCYRCGSPRKKFKACNDCRKADAARKESKKRTK